MTAPRVDQAQVIATQELWTETALAAATALRDAATRIERLVNQTTERPASTIHSDPHQATTATIVEVVTGVAATGPAALGHLVRYAEQADRFTRIHHQQQQAEEAP